MKCKLLAVIVGCTFIFTGIGICLAKSIKLEFPSGNKIKCIYYEVRTGDKRPAVLILPGISGLRTSWRDKYDDFARWLNKEHKFNVLVIDYRARSENEIMKILKKRESMKIVKGEIAEALDFLKGQETVDKEKIGLIGFSFGTVMGIMTTANEDSIKTLILVSLILPPKENWRGPDPDLEQALSKFGNRPVFFLAAKGDNISRNRSNAADNSKNWIKQVKSDSKIEVIKGDSHSVELLQEKGIKNKVADWLQKYLM